MFDIIKQKKPKLNDSIKPHYPSAEILQQPCFEDYRRLIETYDKIYEKVNIALAFCGIVLLVILSNFDYTHINDIRTAETKFEIFSFHVILICSAGSAALIIWSVVQLLLLLRSKKIVVFNSVDIRNEKIYNWEPDNAAMWLIDKYTKAILGLREVISNKQKVYDATVIKIVVSLVLYSISLIFEKGV